MNQINSELKQNIQFLKKEKIVISVVVPIYNTVEYLKDCLDSIVRQTYKDFQIVLIDDGSTDGSEKICDEYAKSDKRIKVLHTKNGGLVSARKKGLREADGEYIYYVDSDDWLDENIIEEFVNILQKYEVDMVSVGIKREYGNNKSLISPVAFEEGFYNRKAIEEKMLIHIIETNEFFKRGQDLGYYNYLIRKEVLENNIKGIDNKVRIGEDIACIYPCIFDAENIYIMNNVFYHYRQRNDSMKWTESQTEYENLQLLYKTLVCKFANMTERKDLILKAVKYLLMFYILISDYERLKISDGVFPFAKFPKGSKVVVYGAGVFGNRIVEFLNKDGYADIAAWVDENYKEYQNKGLHVESPVKILEIEYDYIILGVLRSEIRYSIKRNLEKYSVPQNKIIDIDIDAVDHTALPIEFERILQNAPD